ncbi:putative transcription factor C3H family [Lupinus albus]|uniref:Putative transcription factor C3H family n=1 Tax=Lupinus albus TaxID=3870 RepID=A0A6A4PBQ9_LUPAL|nr:putative transcription factor C3H family [Lupinus albus]
MDIKSAPRNEQRFGGKQCSYWLAGRCNRNPCRFLHSVTPSTSSPYYTAQYNNKPRNAYHYTRKSHSHYSHEKPITNHKYYNSKAMIVRETNETCRDEKSVTKQSSQSLCKYWVNDNCVKGDNCHNLHSWFCGDGFSTLAKLQHL